MENKYTESYTLKVSDYNRFDLLAPHGVLDILQDIAGKHSVIYNMAYEDLIVKNQIWVLLRVKYKVIKNIPLYSRVKVITWPKEKGLVDFDRETQIADLDGNIIVNAISKWVILDATTKRIIPAKHVDYKFPICEDSLFEKSVDRIKDFPTEGLSNYKCKVEFCDIDHNGHTNNAKYAMMIMNALSLEENELIDEFQIDYVHETYLHDDITVYHYNDGKTIYVKGVSNDKTIFLSKITLK